MYVVTVVNKNLMLAYWTLVDDDDDARNGDIVAVIDGG